ncbi:hypothetical protein UCDDS831_g05895 [Diplodia seriata]|uniref:Uncharacterized protein n=1 Tax=Diplodia seriata TaxID=420778 RepID=A0A0G2E7J7_9PEZI|nr:hypothetical protein UCDDS831_g05895 [Diplodia seriata]
MIRRLVSDQIKWERENEDPRLAMFPLPKITAMMEQQLIRGLERRIAALAFRDGPGAARYLASRQPSLYFVDDLILDDRAKSFVDLDANKDLHGGFGRVYSWPCLRVRPLGLTPHILFLGYL